MRKDTKVVKYCDLQIERMPQTQLNIWLSPFEKQHRNPCQVHPSFYQDLHSYHDWLVKKAIIYLHIKLMGKSKCIHHCVPLPPPPQKSFALPLFPISSGYYSCPKRNKRQWSCKMFGVKQCALSFEANFSFFSLAESPPHDLQITAQK